MSRNTQSTKSLAEQLSLVPVGGKDECGIDAQLLWTNLGKPSKRFRDWWPDAIARQALVENVDYVTVFKLPAKAQGNGRGGRRSKQYFLTAHAAKRVAASDSSPRGRALLTALIDIEARLQAGDPELIMHAIDCIRDPEVYVQAQDRTQMRARQYWLRQGKSEEWFAQWWTRRTQGIATRVAFTATLQSHDVKDEGYARCTNAVYQSTLGKTAKQMRDERQLDKSTPLRNTMSETELLATQFAEHMARLEIEKKDIRGNTPCENVCRQSGDRVHAALPDWYHEDAAK